MRHLTDANANSNNNATTFIYDKANRKTRDRVHAVTIPNGLVSTTAYDRAGRIVSLVHQQNAATVVSYVYADDMK
jgi:hypothetical protein